MERSEVARYQKYVVHPRGTPNPSKVWFPVLSDRMGECTAVRCTIGDREAWFLAPASHNPLPSRMTPGEFLAWAKSSRQITLGYSIPFDTLPPDWYMGSTASIEPKFIAAIFQAKACLSIRIQQKLPWQEGFADSPLQALQTGKGKAIHLATILLAALRVHGVPSYISGDPDFFGRDRPHWWVEAYLGEGWQVLETAVEKRILDEFRRRKHSMRMLAELLREPPVHVGPTCHSSRISKVQHAPIAPEFTIGEGSK